MISFPVAYISFICFGVTGQYADNCYCGSLFSIWFNVAFVLLDKEPICAAYVKYDYNGDDALNNPLL